MRFEGRFEGAALVVAAVLASGARAGDAILVRDKAGGCYHHAEREDEWLPDGDGYRCGERRIHAMDLERLRRTALAAPEHVEDLLASVDVTPRTVAEHRDTILAASMPPTWKEDGAVPELTPELEALLTYDSLEHDIENELLGHNWGSTEWRRFEVVLPGDPPVTVRSEGLVPWMLPWTVEAGGRAWTTDDVAVSRALLELAALDGPCRRTLDGASYWKDGFYRDESFWPRFVGAKLDAALSAERYAKLPSYLDAMQRFEVEKAMTGSVNLMPEAIFFHLNARYPSLVDRSRWYCFLEQGEPTSTWDDFLRAIASVQAAARPHAWLASWKRGSPERSVRAEIAGGARHAQRHVERFVAPAWTDAGLPGEPEIVLHLMRRHQAVATVWLDDDADTALIVRAKPDAGDEVHALDVLDLSFHPNAPTYALVRADGAVEVRTIGEDR